jgi:hypothetical protein
MCNENFFCLKKKKYSKRKEKSQKQKGREANKRIEQIKKEKS